jgi:uncharacterized protein (UPF0335 family)
MATPRRQVRQVLEAIDRLEAENQEGDDDA